VDELCDVEEGAAAFEGEGLVEVGFFLGGQFRVDADDVE